MKTSFSISKLLFQISLLLLVLSLVTSTLEAQDMISLNNETSQGSWKVFTNYATRSTSVKFFNKEKEVIYTELLGDQYIELTKRNIKILDETLARLLNNQLVSSQIKPGFLLWEEERKISPNEKGSVISKDVKANAFPLSTPMKFRVLVENPSQKKVTILLKGEQGEAYHESIFLKGYTRIFDLSGMKEGNYTILVKSGDYEYKKELLLYNNPADHQIKLMADFNPCLLISNRKK